MARIDPSSGTWSALKREIDERIEKLRSDLEIPGMGRKQTEQLRGEIIGLRWVKKTVEPDAPVTEPTGTDYLQDRAPKP
jgi:hypothetical protein